MCADYVGRVTKRGLGGDHYRTYALDVEDHENRIEVYGSEELAETIKVLLNLYIELYPEKAKEFEALDEG